MGKKESNYGLPKGWINTTLGEICVIYSGGTPDRKNSNFFKGNIPWVKSGELNFNTITDTEEHISQVALENSSARILPKGSLLVALYGATVGKLAILGIEATTNQAVAALIPTESIYNRYLFFYLLNNKEKLLQQRQGGAQPNISQKILYDFIIPLPPLLEQYRIVSKIDELLNELEQANGSLIKASELLSLQRKTMLRDAFTGKLTNNLSDGLPNSWKEMHIKDCSDLIQYGFTAKSSFKISGPKFLRITDIQKEKVNWSLVPNCTINDEDLKKYALQKDDIVFARSGNTVGKSYLIDSLPMPAVFASYLIRIKYSKSLVVAKYIYYYFQTEAFWKQIRDDISGIGQPNFNGTKLSNIIIPIPPIKEQDQIIEKIEYNLSIISKVEDNINDNLNNGNLFKFSILGKAFSGKLVAQEPDDEPAENLLLKIISEKEAYLNNAKLIAKNKPKKIKLMENNKTIIEILKDADETVSAKDVWLNSLYYKDIDAFYAALKDHIEKGEVKEIFPRKGNESLLSINGIS